MYVNLQELLEEDLQKFGDKDYVFEKRDGVYTPIKFGGFIFKARALATKLINDGLMGQRIMLIGKNSVNIMIADTAITAYTGICASINASTVAEDLEGFIENVGIKAVLYGSDQAEKIASLKNDVIKMNIDEVIPQVNEVGTEFKPYNFEECAKIVFTGGTTSKPKGVMLSYKNMFYGWPYLQRRTKFYDTDIMYMFLPLHHTYADLYMFYYSFFSGLTLYLCSDTAKIGEEVREIRPTIFCAVPLVYERIAEAYHNDVHEAFGDRIRFLFAGGAPIKEELKQVYKNCGFEILNAYALSETASSFAVSYPGDTEEDDVGAVYEDLDVKFIDIDENGAGEICVKGDCVFLGYTNGDTDYLTEDGYFKTGDLGYIKNGKLFVTGRKKKVLIGSNGENIYPDDLLAKIKDMDSNVNFVRFSIQDDQLHAEFYLAEADKTNLAELVEKFNNESTKKDHIISYELSAKKNNEKLMG